MKEFASPVKTRPKSAALLLGVACTLLIGIASAQSDGRWIDRALDRAERLDAPWAPAPKLEQPARGELDSVVPVVVADEGKAPLALAVPAEPDAQEDKPSFDVRSVDDFDDPWAPEAEVEVSTTELVYPWDDKVEPTEQTEPNKVELASPPPTGSGDDNYPWLD